MAAEDPVNRVESEATVNISLSQESGNFVQVIFNIS